MLVTREVVKCVLRKLSVDECFLASYCMLMTLYLWHHQCSSFVDVWMNGDLALLTKD